MGAVGDCELIRYEILGQPVNTVSALAFVVAGGWLLRIERAKWVGLALIATGLGSFVFHGPMPSWASFAHDVSLTWLIAVVGGLRTRWERWSRWPSLLLLSALFALFPLVANPLAVALSVVVVFSILRRSSSRAELAPLGMLALAALLGRLGATGWPLCDPGSPLQTHAIWHVVAAVAVAWWANLATRHAEPALSQP